MKFIYYCFLAFLGFFLITNAFPKNEICRSILKDHYTFDKITNNETYKLGNLIFLFFYFFKNKLLYYSEKKTF